MTFFRVLFIVSEYNCYVDCTFVISNSTVNLSNARLWTYCIVFYDNDTVPVPSTDASSSNSLDSF